MSESIGVPLKEFVIGRSQSEVARLIGVTQGSVWQMLGSDRDIRIKQLDSGEFVAYEIRRIGTRGLKKAA